MMKRSIAEVLDGWNLQELGDLCILLEINPHSSIDDICNAFRIFYHPPAEEFIKSKTQAVIDWFKIKIRVDDTVDIPSYDALVIGACEYLNAYDQNATSAEQEMNLSEAVIIQALQRMKPGERHDFFTKQIKLDKIAGRADIRDYGLVGPATTFGVLGVATASNFGIYLASSTAVGFLTHAVGITLPFAFYTGMSSTIAFLIGPFGWLSAAGIWAGFVLSRPSWTKLIPAILLIISTNSRRALG